MNVDYINEVQSLYVAYFSRPADPGGLAFWNRYLQDRPDAIQDIARAFASSAEYRSVYGGLDNRAMIAEIYDNLFGRAAEGAGIDFWARALDTGALGIDNVVLGIAAGAQDADRVAFNAKVDVAMLFTDHIDTVGEALAYQGEKVRIAVDYIAAVKDAETRLLYIDPVKIDETILKIVGTQTMAEALDPVLV
ncbi:DUF4214 domain-containing protein [Massilia oculi]|uniref:DUF4214 domain-containing protein n=1 Tax=Massilia hydrophila TaxID=3044279 RepID=A0ABS7Y3Z7_9BURK|nr:DUF4214 domain-containing protein [Massilia oculi]MCA1854385.1 DUF4214 domain-containing protein [Massilia oculi]